MKPNRIKSFEEYFNEEKDKIIKTLDTIIEMGLKTIEYINTDGIPEYENIRNLQALRYKYARLDDHISNIKKTLDLTIFGEML